MDGLEYKRTKFNPLVRKFVFWEEKMAVKHSHYLVADNMGIQDYYNEKYGKPSKFLAYGADIHDDYDSTLLQMYDLEPNNYYLIMARIEPENNLEMAIEGYLASKEKDKRPLIIVGRTNTAFALELIKKFGDQRSVKFLGGIYDLKTLNSIRHFSYAYFHGHSVGGTNPSLLEAMASGVMMLAHDNVFNRAVLHDNALYYQDPSTVKQILDNIDTLVNKNKQQIIDANLSEIRQTYSWKHLIDQHEEYFKWLLEDKGKNRLQNIQ
jgi:glycosyltransferase involved in cell wall biosynthesis